MKPLLATVAFILTFQILLCAPSIRDDMKLDQVIMAAAKSHEMFDLVHDMGDGEMMVMVELDLLMTLKELDNYARGSKAGRYKRKATSNDGQLWKDCNVNYEITTGDFSRSDIDVIKRAIDEWSNFTCLMFRETSSAPNRIVFRNGGGCYSRLGMVGGPQPIALAPGCRRKGIVVHEIGHAIGWIHEQARPDRDMFVTVNFNQIPPNWRSQFSKVREELIDDRDVTYDYDSIMHYSGDVFGERTIATRNARDQDRLGQRIGLSFRDIKLANLMYGCAAMNACPIRNCPGEAFQGKDCRCYCPGPVGNPVTLCQDQETTGTVTRPTTRRPVTTTTAVQTTSDNGIVAPPGPECMDVRGTEYCERMRDEGGCRNDTARLSVYCRKTCNLCDESKSCMDYDDACPFFASNGYCERDGLGQFFRDECRLSCKICTPTEGCQAALDSNASTSGSSISVVMTIVMFFAAFASRN